ncbi:MAG: NERD domain-containing protein [Chloroflexi bacterium]|nr:NERD domain-containing protein [Chloroflexota bacterium]MCL5074851.1 NERD domain-containing protein [Chloroflexota bacterium]
MQIVTDQQFVRRRATIGRLSTLLGFALFLGGFALSLNIAGPYSIYYAYAALIAGLYIFSIGRYNFIRWGVKPREDEVIANALKGLDHKYHLLNYLPQLPVRHLLLSPIGLFIIDPKQHYGQISLRGGEWRHKRSIWSWFTDGLAEGGLGNPTLEARRNEEAVRRYLAQRLSEEEMEQVQIKSIVVFMSPRAKLEVVEPQIPAVTPKELRGLVRRPQDQKKIDPQLQRKIVDILTTQGLS